MRTAILSDIHGNLEALTSVLEDLDSARIDRTVSLGDMVGYGPRPGEVIDTLLARSVPSIRGNHELAVTRPAARRWFNPSARLSIEITRELLSDAHLAIIEELSTSLSMGWLRFVHGFPPDSVTRYLFEASYREIRDTMEALPEEICFVGHTHELRLVTVRDGTVQESRPGDQPMELPPGARYLVNAGSVGQPRDGDNRAKYVIWDDETRALEVRRVAYDVEKTVREILMLGFPSINAERLR
jgi:predicted phosphodiesterase